MSHCGKTTIEIKKKHNDLIRSILKIKDIHITKVGFKHVYGHQDKSVPTSQLSAQARNNIEVDQEAQNTFDYAYEFHQIKLSLQLEFLAWSQLSHTPNNTSFFLVPHSSRRLGRKSLAIRSRRNGHQYS